MKNVQVLKKRLAAAGSRNARRAAEELSAHVLGCKPLEIYFRDPTPEQERELEELIVRAELGEPIQYMIGHVDFRGLEIRCDRRALIPRPETEGLVEVVLENVDATPPSRSVEKGKRDGGVASTLKIADVGCGTGCIGLALLAELPNAKVVAVDISPDALALARENAEHLGLSDRMTFIQNDLLNVAAVSPPRSVEKEKRGGDTASTLEKGARGGIAFFPEQSFDIVVSNPPYIVSGVWKDLEPCVRDFEPQLALDGGADGLDLIRPLIAQAARVLKPGGGLFLEIGYDQGAAVFQCLEEAGFQNVRIIKDLAGYDRIVCGRK